MSRCENMVAPMSSCMMSSSVGITVCARGMALLASLTSTFNRTSLIDCFGVITTVETQPVHRRLVYFLDYVISSSTSSLGLLWGCARGSIAGLTCKSTCIPFTLIPIPLKRSAYSPTSLLIAVSFDWTEFATSTKPKSSAVWNPFNSLMFVRPFTTRNLARLDHRIKFSNQHTWPRFQCDLVSQ